MPPFLSSPEVGEPLHAVRGQCAGYWGDQLSGLPEPEGVSCDTGCSALKPGTFWENRDELVQYWFPPNGDSTQKMPEAASGHAVLFRALIQVGGSTPLKCIKQDTTCMYVMLR